MTPYREKRQQALKQRIAEFNARLREHGYTSYREYLASDHWRDVKRRYWDSKLPKHCGGCGATKGLQLHHKTYKRICAERLMDITPVCRACHEGIHDFEHASGKHPWQSTKHVLKRNRKQQMGDLNMPSVRVMKMAAQVAQWRACEPDKSTIKCARLERRVESISQLIHKYVTADDLSKLKKRGCIHSVDFPEKRDASLRNGEVC